MITIREVFVQKWLGTNIRISTAGITLLLDWYRPIYFMESHAPPTTKKRNKSQHDTI